MIYSIHGTVHGPTSAHARQGELESCGTREASEAEAEAELERNFDKASFRCLEECFLCLLSRGIMLEDGIRTWMVPSGAGPGFTS